MNLESVARVLRTVWRTEKSFELHDLGENKVLFHFGLKEDLDRVLLLGPWSFDKYLLILHKLNEGEAVTKVKFDRTSFWVQIHGLPTMCQTKDAGLLIGGTLGTMEKLDVDNKGFSMGSHLRIRVSLDTSLPLCRGQLVRLGGPFRFESMWLRTRWVCLHWWGNLNETHLHN